jgi:hypothetical protein
MSSAVRLYLHVVLCKLYFARMGNLEPENYTSNYIMILYAVEAGYSAAG